MTKRILRLLEDEILAGNHPVAIVMSNLLWSSILWHAEFAKYPNGVGDATLFGVTVVHLDIDVDFIWVIS